MKNNMVILNPGPAKQLRSKLPTSVKTRGGTVFDPSRDVWSFKEDTQKTHINFSLFPACTLDFLDGLKLTLIWFAENRAAKYLANMFKHFLYFSREICKTLPQPLDCITDIHILNYKATLSVSKEWYLRYVSLFVKHWHRLGHHGTDASAVALLNALRLKSSPKGEAVLTMDPVNGPYTDIELESIQASLTKAYAANEINTSDYLLVWLFMLLGARPIQFSRMKVCDFYVIETKDGGTEYCLRVPRAKQRHGQPRFEFKERLITPQIGELLKTYVKDTRSRFIGLLTDSAQAPLFPTKHRYHKSTQGYEYHVSSDSISTIVEKSLGKLHPISERTGKPLHITATRFRRTLGTRAAAEGHGELIIAELLDHSDTSNVGVYVQATPAIVERIDKAVALQMAPLAQAFAGVLIKSEAEAVRGSDPSSRIMDPRIDRSMKAMGSCGSHGFCGQFAPIACYTCTNFQPWLDGPHEAVLNHLVEERERMLGTTDIRIAAVNDRTILAVAEVVRRCGEALATMKEGDLG